MARMPEMDAEIRCFLSEGLNPVQVAHRLCIPLQWVIDYENDEILGQLPTTDDFADADAISYGNFWQRSTCAR